jgi:hypothetical protein
VVQRFDIAIKAATPKMADFILPRIYPIQTHHEDQAKRSGTMMVPLLGAMIAPAFS